jgi:hypothetical protein
VTDAPDDAASVAVVAPLPNLNDFTLLANGGFDPGWRVGYGSAWVVQLPPAPAGRWTRAFLGAKIGRAKLEPVPGRPPWEKRRVKGDIDIALSSEPLWPQSRRHLLTRAEEIPLEGDPDNPVDGVGESRWFWVEIPVKHVAFDAPNFIALYSTARALAAPERAPVLAAGPRPVGVAAVNTWLSGGVGGQPPMGAAEALKTPVRTYAPAVAIKLLAASTDEPPSVRWTEFPAEDAASAPFQLGASVTGSDVAQAWVEVSTDTRAWSRFSAPLPTPPYLFTVDPSRLPSGDVWTRIAASDAAERRGNCDPRKLPASLTR